MDGGQRGGGWVVDGWWMSPLGAAAGQRLSSLSKVPSRSAGGHFSLKSVNSKLATVTSGLLSGERNSERRFRMEELGHTPIIPNMPLLSILLFCILLYIYTSSKWSRNT